MQSPIIVLGTGRSGTSIIAGMLNYLGVNMGDTFVPADQNNPAGHWEDAEVAALVRLALLKEIDEETLKAELRNIAEDRARQGGVWGWKLPATANILPVIMAMPEFKHAKFIRSDRPLEEFKESCVRCYADNGMTPERAEQMHKVRVDIMDRMLPKERTMLTEHAMVIDDPQGLRDTLIEFTGLEPTEQQKKLALTMVDKTSQDARVMIAIPNMGELNADLVRRLLEWKNQYRAITYYMPVNFTPVECARNEIVREFLEGDCTHLWMIDADTIPPVWAMKTLLSSELDVVSGATPMMRRNPNTDKWEPMWNTLRAEMRDGEKVHLEYRGHGIEEIDRVGGSCLMLKRHVVEDMVKRAPLFQTTLDDAQIKKTLGEDIFFSDRAKAEGYQIFANFNVVCKHAKTVQI